MFAAISLLLVTLTADPAPECKDGTPSLNDGNKVCGPKSDPIPYGPIQIVEIYPTVLPRPERALQPVDRASSSVWPSEHAQRYRVLETCPQLFSNNTAESVYNFPDIRAGSVPNAKNKAQRFSLSRTGIADVSAAIPSGVANRATTGIAQGIEQPPSKRSDVGSIPTASSDCCGVSSPASSLFARKCSTPMTRTPGFFRKDSWGGRFCETVLDFEPSSMGESAGTTSGQRYAGRRIAMRSSGPARPFVSNGGRSSVVTNVTSPGNAVNHGVLSTAALEKDAFGHRQVFAKSSAKNKPAISDGLGLDFQLAASLAPEVHGCVLRASSCSDERGGLAIADFTVAGGIKSTKSVPRPLPPIKDESDSPLWLCLTMLAQGTFYLWRFFNA